MIQKNDFHLIINSFENVQFVNSNSIKSNSEQFSNSEILIIPPKYLTIFTLDTIQLFKKLKYVIVASSGYDGLNLELLKNNNIKVSNCPGANSIAVSEFTMFQILDQAKRVNYEHNHHSIELNKKTIGIIGTGYIGKLVCKKALAFGMRVIGNNKRLNNVYPFPEICRLEKLLFQSDFVSLHIPLNDETKDFINRKKIKLMKKGVIIINASRPELINIEALIDALENKHIAGYSQDGEFLVAKKHEISILRSMNNVLFTPHIAYKTKESKIRTEKIILRMLQNYRRGKILYAI